MIPQRDGAVWAGVTIAASASHPQVGQHWTTLFALTGKQGA
ncbi:hypothetical protein OOK60_07645 [Trichothermofontia sichuanensis B231]|nr:hypothetical protein [Trichothermofontia sichuanensis]UZQ55926.1 hypothetical protein OOK60_07645 [Trichothermofontia sichuanensis B231]